MTMLSRALNSKLLQVLDYKTDGDNSLAKHSTFGNEIKNTYKPMSKAKNFGKK